MSQLKPSYVEKIRKALSTSIFSLSDFDLDFPTKGEILLKITFKHVPEYTFSVREEETYEEVTSSGIASFASTKKNKLVSTLSVDVSPGNYKKSAVWSVRNFDSLPSQIPEWCQNIRDDLYTLSPDRDPMERL